jgi:MFS family permease
LNTIWVLAVATSLSLLGDMTIYAVLPSRHAALGISVAGVGVLLSVHRFIRIGANSAAGVLCDRLGRRPPYLLGLALAVVATAGYLLPGGFWPLLAARLVWGLAFALIHVGAFAIVLDVTTPADRERALGAYSSLVGAGTMLAVLLGGAITDLAGYHVTLAAWVPLTALGLLVAWAGLPETRPATPAAPAIHGGTTHVSLRAAYRQVGWPLLPPCYVSFIAFFAGNGVLMATIGKHVAAGADATWPLATLTGLLLALRRAVGIVTAPLAGRLSDRIGDRRQVAALGALVGIAGFAVLALGQGMAAVVLGAALTALGEGILVPAVSAWCGDLAPIPLRGVIMGGLATANDFGGAVGPLVGYAVGATLGFHTAYALCAALGLSSLLALALARGPRRAPAVVLPSD